MPPDDRRSARRDTVAAVLARQHGVLTRAQARAAGMTTAQVDRLLRVGAWRRLLPSIYDAADDPSPLAPYAAAALWAGPGGALSHGSAAALWRLLPPSGAPEVLVPVGRAAQAAGVVVRRTRAPLGAADRATVAGLPVTSPTRTVVDLSSALDDDGLARVVERARAAGILRRSDLLAHLDAVGARGRAGAARLRRVVAGLGPGPRTAPRLAVEVAAVLRDFGPPESGHGPGVLVWSRARILVECDGRTASERRRDRFADRERRSRLVAAGWRIAVVTWDDAARLPTLGGHLVGGRA